MVAVSESLETPKSPNKKADQNMQRQTNEICIKSAAAGERGDEGIKLMSIDFINEKATMQCTIQGVRYEHCSQVHKQAPMKAHITENINWENRNKHCMKHR